MTSKITANIKKLPKKTNIDDDDYTITPPDGTINELYCGSECFLPKKNINNSAESYEKIIKCYKKIIDAKDEIIETLELQIKELQEIKNN